MKHTKGPWKIRIHPVVGFQVTSIENEICYCRSECLENEANAHLTAAAPEMLEALKLILRDTLANGVNADAEHVRILEQAIAKAEGR